LAIDKHDHLIKTLELTNGWINNCDTKTSFILGFYGVVGAVLVALLENAGIFSTLRLIVCDFSFGGVLFILLFAAAIICSVYGVVKLILVIYPRIYKGASTTMFFGGVAAYKDLAAYTNAVLTQKDDDLLKDICVQIYAASKICDKKFKHYRQGLIWTLLGCAMFAVLLVVNSGF